MSEITLDRLRIVRNGIVREWQQTRRGYEQLPENAFSKKGLMRYMGGLRAALEELYGEFPELERIPMDQKPRCPFCGEEMDHPALADHMQEHALKGDNIRGISFPGISRIDAGPMFGDITDTLEGILSAGSRQRIQSTPISPLSGLPGIPLTPDMKIGPIHLVEDGPIEVLIEGIKYKKPSTESLYGAADVLQSFITLETDEGEGADEGLCDVVEYLRRIAGSAESEYDDKMRLEQPEDGITAEEYEKACPEIFPPDPNRVCLCGSTHSYKMKGVDQWYCSQCNRPVYPTSAGGQGDAVHPDPDPSSDDPTSSPEEP